MYIINSNVNNIINPICMDYPCGFSKTRSY